MSAAGDPAPALPPSDGDARRVRRFLPQQLLNFVLFVTVLTSAIAFIEPSPHDVLMFALFAMCVGARVRFDRKLVPLVVLLALWLLGACLSLIQLGDQARASNMRHVDLSWRSQPSCSPCLFCDGDLVRLSVLRRAYILAALIATAAGYIGFFHLFPRVPAFPGQ